MWLLPSDLSVPSPLEPGRYLLPWYYDDPDIDRLLALLGRLLPDLSCALRLPWEVLLAGRPLQRLDNSLVAVTLPLPPPASEEVVRALTPLPTRYLLVQHPHPQRSGYGWLEKRLKRTLITALLEHIRDPEHPLAGLSIEHLPVHAAAGLTADALQLVDLLTLALVHRLRYATYGLEPQDYLRSLLHAAGEALAQQLSRLPAEALGAALELLLHEALQASGAGPPPLEAERYRQGAQALEARGLGRLSAGEVSLKPLAQAVRKREVRGVLAEQLRTSPWPPAAQELLADLDRHQGGTARGELPQPEEPPPPSERWLAEPTATRSSWITELAGASPPPAIGQAAGVLEQLGQQPSWQEALPPELQTRVARTLRSLAQAAAAGEVDRRAAGLWAEAIRFRAARGKELLTAREAALALIEAFAEPQPGQPAGAFAQLAATLRLELAESLTRSPRDRDDLARAADIAQAVTEQALPSSPALAKGYHLLGNIAQKRDELDRALGWHTKALRIKEAQGDHAGVAASCRRLGSIAQARGKLDEAETWYTKSLVINGAQGNRAELAAIYHQLGTVAQERGAPDEAGSWYERALEIFEALQNRSRMALGYHQLGVVFQNRGELEVARSWYTKALEIAEELENRASLAAVYHQLGTLAQQRGELDEAGSFYQRSLEIKEELGSRPGLALSYGQLGLLAEERGQPAEALAWAVRCVSLFPLDHPATGSGWRLLVRLVAVQGLAALEAAWQKVTAQSLPTAIRSAVLAALDTQAG